VSDGVDMKRHFRVSLPYGVAQPVDFAGQQIGAAIEQIYGEEIGATGNPVAAVIRQSPSFARPARWRNALRFSALRGLPSK
jgi:hypothetical protein